MTKQKHKYVGMWVTTDGHIRHELLADGRYDEARGRKQSAYQGNYVVTGNHIDYEDDTGFTADGEFRELLERVRGLAAHRSPNADLPTLMKKGLAAYERELEKERFGVGRKARPRHAKAGAGSTIERRRQRRVAVAREVYERDIKQCTFVSADGRRCTSRYGLELDHVQAWALGGADTASNQRLCRAHNQARARQTFGKAHVAEAIRRSYRS